MLAWLISFRSLYFYMLYEKALHAHMYLYSLLDIPVPAQRFVSREDDMVDVYIL